MEIALGIFCAALTAALGWFLRGARAQRVIVPLESRVLSLQEEQAWRLEELADIKRQRELAVERHRAEVELAAGFNYSAGPGWTERVFSQLREHGPVTPAWFEAVMRAPNTGAPRYLVALPLEERLRKWVDEDREAIGAEKRWEKPGKPTPVDITGVQDFIH